MHKIDSPGATAGGLFKETPLPATRVDAVWLNAVQTELVNLVTHALGGDAALNKANTGQLLAAILAMIGRAFTTRAVDARFTQIERVVEDEEGGDDAPYSAADEPQLLEAVLAMIARAFTTRAVDARFAQIQRVVEDVEGGDDAPYSAANQPQLLNAVLAMIDRAVANVVTIDVESGDEKTITFGGGLLILKQGYWRETFSAEVTRTINFQTPFPAGCWSVLTQGVLSSASIYKDLWTQVIDPSRSVSGFQVQLQSDDDNDHGLAGFDWWAIGN